MTDTPAKSQSKPGPRVTDTPTESETESRVGRRFWLHRPYTRVVRGWRAYQVVRDYIWLNEAEVTGVMPYRKDRLRGISEEERALLVIASLGRPPSRVPRSG